MPLYEYRCSTCDHRFEILQRLGASARGVDCPECGGGSVVKEHSTFASVGSSSTERSSGGADAASAGCGTGFT